MLEGLQSVLHIRSAHNKGGPPNINIVQISHFSNSLTSNSFELFNYGKTVVNKAFPCFWFCLCRFNSSIFNDFHAYVSHNRTNWATHSTEATHSVPSPEELVGQFFKHFDDINKPSGDMSLYPT